VGASLGRGETDTVATVCYDRVALAARGFGATCRDEWFRSGTIGVARTAAFLGIPAMAIPGIARSTPEAIEAVADARSTPG
jgi:hypothetical protein